jgi:phage terminase Nu1 subunit (DNA packaging protein)
VKSLISPCNSIGGAALKVVIKFDPNQAVSTTELAEVLGLTARRVQQLAQDGILNAEERGAYPLAESVQAYIEQRTREKAAGSAELEKLEAEAKLKKAKAVMAEIEAQELQGKMHRAEDVEAAINDLVGAVRSAMVALPGRVATDAANASTPLEASEVIRSEVNKAMDELSRYTYDSGRFAEQAKVRKGRLADGAQDDIEGAADDSGDNACANADTGDDND